MDITQIIIFASLLVIILFLFARWITRKSSNIGKTSEKGSEIIGSRYKKYKSIKDIPIIKSNLGKNIIVAYFNHAQCSGCKVLTPKFLELMDDKDFSDIQFENINADIAKIDFQSIGVLFVPTILVFDIDGDLSKNLIGLIQGSAEKVILELKSALSDLKRTD